MMARPRNTYKYYFKVGNKIIHGGITNDLEEREKDHQQKWLKGHIVQVGRCTTEEAAREWEKKKGFI
jgi:predicted GIY-YIG superfamily endonuclease